MRYLVFGPKSTKTFIAERVQKIGLLNFRFLDSPEKLCVQVSENLKKSQILIFNSKLYGKMEKAFLKGALRACLLKILGLRVGKILGRSPKIRHRRRRLRKS